MLCLTWDGAELARLDTLSMAVPAVSFPLPNPLSLFTVSAFPRSSLSAIALSSERIRNIQNPVKMNWSIVEKMLVDLERGLEERKELDLYQSITVNKVNSLRSRTLGEQASQILIPIHDKRCAPKTPIAP